VRREFGRTVPPPTSSTSTSTSTSAPSAALALANTSSAAVLNGLVGGVRALAAAPAARSRALSSSSSTAFAKQRMARQAASISVPSPTATTSSSGRPSTDGSSPRLSQSSMSSVAEEKTDLEKAEGPPGEDVEGAAQASALGGGSSRSSTKRPLVAQRPQLQLQTQQEEEHHRPPSSSELPPSASSKTVQRRSRDLRAPLADALKPLTGRGSGKRASISVISPTSMSISGINPLGAMGLGRANLGEAAQGWVDSVGSKLAELQRGET
jgi:hypothetical protein